MAPGERNRGGRLERRVLLSPDVVCRAAAAGVSEPEGRWMLAQPRGVRRTYVAEVLDKPGSPELLRQVWMLRQNKAVRESYIRAVLKPGISPPSSSEQV
jgi:hypothetical protein